MAFDPDQPRDESGKWTSGGTGFSGQGPREAISQPGPSRTIGKWKTTDDDEEETLKDWVENQGAVRSIREAEVKGGNETTARMNSVLDKAPVFEGTAFRGITLKDPEAAESMFRVGSTVELEAMSSFTADPETAKGFSLFRTSPAELSQGESVVIRVDGVKNGAAVWGRAGSLAKEREVILRKGFKFRVKAVGFTSGTRVTRPIKVVVGEAVSEAA